MGNRDTGMKGESGKLGEGRGGEGAIGRPLECVEKKEKLKRNGRKEIQADSFFHDFRLSVRPGDVKPQCRHRFMLTF
jgi:hypothetical protein